MLWRVASQTCLLVELSSLQPPQIGLQPLDLLRAQHARHVLRSAVAVRVRIGHHERRQVQHLRDVDDVVEFVAMPVRA